MTSLMAQLQMTRHNQFIGRINEVETFKTAVTAPQLPFHILYVSGPGGVGKTSLLHEFDYHCTQLNYTTYYLDASDIDPTPQAFTISLSSAMSLPPNVSPLEALAAQNQKSILFIDQIDHITILERWLKRHFLLQLPTQTLIVFASRQTLSSHWHVDPGWRSLIHTMPLHNFTCAESEIYLNQHSIPQNEWPTILTFTHGHPLALALVADLFQQQPNLHFEPDTTPETMHKLVTRFVANLTTAQRQALEACTLVRRMTEQLLAKMLNQKDVHHLFNWLRTLSLIESGTQGIWVQDVARETLMTDLRWRNIDRYRQLHKIARQHYNDCLQQEGQSQQNILIDYIFLHRDNPTVRPFFTQLQQMGSGNSNLMADTAVSTDWPTLIEMVSTHEGNSAAQWAAYWLQQQPEGALVLRDENNQIQGFLLTVTITTSDETLWQKDPATKAVWDFLAQKAPLRQSEKALLFRFWLDRQRYQDISPTQSVLFVHMVRHYLVTTNLAYTFMPCANPALWQDVLAYADIARLPASDFELDGRHYGMYGHDWRQMPPQMWLDLLAQRETATNEQTISTTPKAETFLVLNRQTFDTAVRDALRDLHQLDSLATNPLLQTRLLRKTSLPATSSTQLTQELQQLLQKTITTLQKKPRTEKWYNALYYTYVQPLPTQEAAAERLNVPYGSFRRHLRAGITAVADSLWQRDIA